MRTIVVCGSRTWTDERPIESAMRVHATGAFCFIHGGARGADATAATICAKHGWNCAEYPARWRSEGKKAGMLRNLRMLDTKPSIVLAFWDGQSRGTKHTIDEAKRRGIPVVVYTDCPA